MILISITGHKHAGKTTVANIISAHFNHDSFILGWADALKDEVADATGVSRLVIETQKERFRPILQWWGTDFRRKDDPNYWIHKMEPKILSCDRRVCIIHDTRFHNELDYIKRVGGYCIRVIRPENPERYDSHESEHDLDDTRFMYTITNDGSIKHLERTVEALTDLLKSKI